MVHLKVIEDENPKFFLVSGGRNDIPGKQFKDHFNEGADIPAGSPEKDYFKNSIWEKIDQNYGWYVHKFENTGR